ncbi:class I SAM-dependent methyltransferase [Nakamurella sp.]|uniref:class I SAM-dependent methyltransferase n=1 Tax=Nakamurella sp. TaxID=1869182 RepID=UPI003B3AFD20
MSGLKGMVPSSVKRRAKLLAYQGTKYECPFCGFKARALRPHGHDFDVLKQRDVVGGGVRPSRCFQCGSADRERLIFLYLRNDLRLLDHPEATRVLHIAPEPRLARALRKVGFTEYIMGDLHAEGYSYPDDVLDIDATNIPFAADSFDLILCSHVLEHIPDDSRAIRELARVLRPGGTAILQVPISANTQDTLEDFSVTDPKAREQVFGQFDHVRIYGQDYVDRLAAGGFTVKRVDVASKYEEYGTNPREELFVCTV